MIIGIGCDIVKISRIKKLVVNFGDKFINRIYTLREIDAANSLCFDKKINYYAKRFAAKEATSKALGTGIGAKVAFIDIEIYNDSCGKPLVKLHCELFKNIKIFVSMSDEDDSAIAYTLAQKTIAQPFK